MVCRGLAISEMDICPASSRSRSRPSRDTSGLDAGTGTAGATPHLPMKSANTPAGLLDDTKLDWDNLNDDLLNNDPLALDLGLIGLFNTLDLQVGGSLELGISTVVKAAGTFLITKVTGKSFDDGAIEVFTGNLLSIKISNVHLFVGDGAGDFTYTDGIATGIDTSNATGFKVSGASLDVAIISSTETTGATVGKSWTGISARVQTMTVATESSPSWATGC